MGVLRVCFAVVVGIANCLQFHLKSPARVDSSLP